MRKVKKNVIIPEVVIESVAAEGKCVGRFEGQVVFVADVAPGDIVDLRIIKKRKSYLEGRVEKFHHYSSLRAQPFCRHFDLCGGCKWQHIQYPEQLKYKQQQVVDHLQRIGKVSLPAISPILASEDTRFYRNKLEYTFSNKKWLTRDQINSGEDMDRTALGFHMPGRFDKVLDMEECHLQPDPSNAIRLAVRDYARAHEMEFYDLVQMHGLVRNLIIRTASTGELMVIVQFGRYEDSIQGLMSYIQEQFPEITSLQYIINEKLNETYHDQEIVLFSGRAYIEEEMEGLRFRIGPKSFYQTNSQQAYTLYKVAREFAGLDGSQVVYDLYTGHPGTIANFVARQAKKVVGIEYVPEAIEDAHINSTVNGIDNTLFFAGDMKDLLTEAFVQEHGHPDVIITDPPRAGMHPDVIQTLLQVAPGRIVYVSCNPATQARDLQLLDAQYKVSAVQPVDMFPHTHHVENVVLLEKR